jgi:acetyltransferase-like isoleucine patch superfamily enzyme
MNIIKRIIRKLKPKKAVTSESFLNSLRKKGIRIGEGTVAFAPRDILIDTTRPELVEIGKNVFLHYGTRILTHDWASWSFVNKYNDFIPSHGKIQIGDNVWLGQNVTILKGVTIGDNVIIGAGAIVNKSIPSNSVAVGSPAKVICTIDEYYAKRKKQYIDECIEYANAILDSGREPQKEDFYDDYPCFVDASNMQEYDYPYARVFKKPEQLEAWKKHHKKTFNGFDDFMKEVLKRREEK